MRADGTGCSVAGDLSLTAGAWPGPGTRAGLQVFVRPTDEPRALRLGQPAEGAAPPILDPTGAETGCAAFCHASDGLRITLRVCVVPGRRAEVRELAVENRSPRPRALEATSLAELALNLAAAHESHPGFSKLFVQTEAAPERGALLARRRARSPDERWPVLVHAVGGAGDLQWETDRLRWRGRGRHRDEPAALDPGARLSGTTGNVLDPVASLRRTLDVAPGAVARLAFLLGVADDRESALALADLVRDDAAVAAVFADAASSAAADRARRGWDVAAEARARALAADLLAGDGGASPDPEPCGTDDESAADRRLAFWRDLGLPFAHRPMARAESPAPPAAAADPSALMAPTPHSQDPNEELTFFNGLGGFGEDWDEYVIRLEPGADGRLRLPPLPWTNVIANERFGCIASETALGASWCDNSRENRLTAWSNDPVLDPPSETFHLRDDETGAWLPCLPGPVAGSLHGGGPAEVRHGFGCTKWLRRAGGLGVETAVFVDRDLPARVCRVRVTNPGPARRRLSLFACTLLGDGARRGPDEGGIVTERDADTGVLLARGVGRGAFADHVAFASAVTDAPGATVHATCDRAWYLGADRDPSAPAALAAPSLEPRTGADLDPCFALQVSFEIPAHQYHHRDVYFVLGQERGVAGALATAAKLATADACDKALLDASDFWCEGLGALTVESPSPALDLMLFGWLAYQTLSCRVRGRSAFYQSGGAYGYRDQLQDSLALLPYWPELTRRQILLHAGHQFSEGDVLHWWHPPMTAGIRTRFADDLLWLPYIACEYARQTGDVAVFDERAPYLTAPALPDGEDEIFVHAAPSGREGTVFEHCCRALDRSLAVGAHGLPLFGTGDWNDGMNRVGRLGRGESTWMGFFLVAIIDAFAPLCDERGETERAGRYRAHRERLAAALNEGGWDGGWYRRGYYDDGAPLGSRENRECRIDALAQAWSVLSGVAPPERAAAAMDQVEAQLISDEERLIRLLTPPFVDTPRDPGYIRGYVAGVRENGGQYTHAATWVVRAMAKLGRRERATQLLDLLNPILHATTPEQVARYMVEPYVVAADVYGAPPHVGRGGWTWYTGSSGWLQRVALESILGFGTEGGDTLVVAPCVPDDWPGFKVSWHLPGERTSYEVTVTNPQGCSQAVVAASVDGKPVAPQDGRARLPLLRDGRRHIVSITLGPGGGDA